MSKSFLDIFCEALEQEDAAERSRFLDSACGTDTALRERIGRLLSAHEAAGGFLSRPSEKAEGSEGTGRGEISITERVGDHIGRYKLLRQIGEGGCGVVYLAEQQEPVRRTVALKIIKLGMDTKHVVARFDAERQALALMEHPNIARALDAGSTESARPYFVMEVVHGVKITEFCDQHRLSPRERLELLIPICQAVQHAHQKGVIHRDLKPSNILVAMVDDVPVPKVIDFGIAKATNNQRLTDKTVFTAFEQFIGTPAYMSPEQAEMSGVDVDTRTDIYSLGVVLYELLTGRTPFDSRELLRAGIDEIRRTIRETDPPTPSTRLNALAHNDLTTVAQARRTDGPKLIHALRGDLDWVVMKCLEKERERRYETANGLARDLQRYLNDEPVAARPPGNLYRFQKFTRRNKGTVAAVAAVAIALIGGIVASTWQAVRATRAEREQSHLRQQAESNQQRAGAEAAKSREVAQFLKNMLTGLSPAVAMGRDTTLLRELLDRTAGRVRQELKRQPEVQAELWIVIGDAYSELGRYGETERMDREALAIYRRLFGNEHLSVAFALDHVASALSGHERHAEAVDLERQALAMRRRLAGNGTVDVAQSCDSLSAFLIRQSQTASAPLAQRQLTEAEALARESLAVRQKRSGSNSLDVAHCLDTLGIILGRQGRNAESVNVFRDVLALRRKAQGNEHLDVASSLLNLAEPLFNENNHAEAESLVREGLAIRRRLCPQNSPSIAYACSHLAVMLSREGKLAEAEAADREAVTLYRKALGDGNPLVIGNMEHLAGVLRDQGKLTEAEPLFREALALSRKLPPEQAAFLLRSLDKVSSLLLAQSQSAAGTERESKLAEAESLAREAVAIREKLFGRESDQRAGNSGTRGK